MDAIGLTNVLTDVIVHVEENDLERFGLVKSFGNSLKKLDLKDFLDFIESKNVSYCCGGSPANVIFNMSVLGLKTGLFGTAGKDKIGEDFISYATKIGVKPLIKRKEGKSGVCYVLITPDGERTQLGDMGVASDFEFNFDDIKKAKVFHTSGYEVASCPEKVKEAVDYAKKKRVKVSFDCADPYTIRKQRQTIESIIKKTDILFATRQEAMEITGDSVSASINYFSKKCDFVALKFGPKGSVIKEKEKLFRIPAYDIKVVNTCGAGDAYASGFLFGYLKGLSAQSCGKIGSYIASEVCKINESHLQT
jgi:sugar/nucleoside kinase (ribokinase family)